MDDDLAKELTQAALDATQSFTKVRPTGGFDGAGQILIWQLDHEHLADKNIIAEIVFKLSATREEDEVEIDIMARAWDLDDRSLTWAKTYLNQNLRFKDSRRQIKSLITDCLTRAWQEAAESDQAIQRAAERDIEAERLLKEFRASKKKNNVLENVRFRAHLSPKFGTVSAAISGPVGAGSIITTDLISTTDLTAVAALLAAKKLAETDNSTVQELAEGDI